MSDSPRVEGIRDLADAGRVQYAARVLYGDFFIRSKHETVGPQNRTSPAEAEAANAWHSDRASREFRPPSLVLPIHQAGF